MAMKIEFQKGSAYMSEVLKKEPSITGFTRLETQPTAVSMKIGLQAPVADPLIGLGITAVILKITWDSWQTVRGQHVH